MMHPAAPLEPPTPAFIDGTIRWALDRVHRYLCRHGYRLIQAAGGPTGMFVGVDEARAVLDGAGTFDLTRHLGIDAPPTSARCPIDTSPTDNISPDPPNAIRTLAARFDLPPLHARLLLAAAVPHLSADVARLYTFALADFTRKLPPAAFLAELVTDTPAAATAAHAALRPDAPLRRSGLIELIPEAPFTRATPAAQLGVLVPAPVVAFLRGEPPALTAALADAVDDPPAPTDPHGAPDPARVDRVRALLTRSAPLLLIGERGAGRRRTFRAAMDPARPLLTIDLDRLPPDPDRFAPLVAEATRAARLYALALLLRADVLLAEPDDPRLPGLARALRHHPDPLAVSARNDAGALHHLTAANPIRFPLPTAPEQRDHWRRALDAVGAPDPGLPDRLVQRFSATPGTIAAAVAEACDRAHLDESPLTLDHLATALRCRIHHALDTIAEPIDTTLTWDDVVLPPHVVDTLHEIRSQARNRLRVFDEWGFRRKMSYGRGLACLFAGPPGTGKTMMAGIIARDLGRELYRVDLSRLVSKWVGETEKNLARVFDEAERAQVILFFDEADSLFATRTEVKGANDRFANMEVNYLLQRMESFDGVTILTTNFERGLDDAFKRRLRFRVHFPLPDASERAALWRAMIPPEMPTDDGIDFTRLGKRHKLSGGNIKNAVLRAAFYAAEDGGILTNALLDKAAEAESRELGRL